MPNALEGGCACGQVRYRLKTAPLFVHCCHCKDCQRQTGTAFVLNALIETDRVDRLSGNTTLFPMPTDSGKPHEVARCATCGTAVWSHYGGLTKLSFIRVGTLDEPSRCRRTCISTPARSCRGSRCPPNVPSFAAYYDSKRLWPAESLERRKALFG